MNASSKSGSTAERSSLGFHTVDGEGGRPLRDRFTIHIDSVVSMDNGGRENKGTAEEAQCCNVEHRRVLRRGSADVNAGCRYKKLGETGGRSGIALASALSRHDHTAADDPRVVQSRTPSILSR